METAEHAHSGTSCLNYWQSSSPAVFSPPSVNLHGVPHALSHARRSPSPPRSATWCENNPAANKGWYNRVRLHSTLNYSSPNIYEEDYYRLTSAA
jgi:hypothetical protein